MNGDGFVTPIDSLLVINYLNLVTGGGEGEASGDVASFAAGDELDQPATLLSAPEIEWQREPSGLAADPDYAQCFGRSAGSSIVRPDSRSLHELFAWLAERITRRR